MFYSQCLLSSKGPLGAIWVAAYFFKKLKKAQVTETDISSSVGSSSFLFSFSVCLCLYTHIHIYCLLSSILGLAFFFFLWGGEKLQHIHSYLKVSFFKYKKLCRYLPHLCQLLYLLFLIFEQECACCSDATGFSSEFGSSGCL